MVGKRWPVDKKKKWELKTLQHNGYSQLTSMDELRRYKRYVEQEGTKYMKYEKIDEIVYE